MGASVFLDAFVLLRGKLPFDFYFYYIIYLLVIFRYISRMKDVKMLPKWMFYSLVSVFAISYITGNIYNTGGFTMHKQVIGISFSALAFYCYVKLEEFQAWTFIKQYLYLSVVVALLGIGDEILHLVGIHLTPIKGTNVGLYRAYSILGEPYFLAVILLPAFYYFLSQAFQKKAVRGAKNMLPLAIIFICILFTFSAAGFMGIGVAVMLVLYQKGFFSFRTGKIFILPFILWVSYKIVFNNKDKVENIKVRIEDTYEAFTTRNLDPEFVADLNSSTFALFTNYIIAEESFNRNPISGSGLGSHILNYDAMFKDFFSEEFLVRFGDFNKRDANSLFLRLMSEMGLVGLILVFLFIGKNFIRRKYMRIPDLVPLVLINHGILVMFIVRLIRTGNYIGNGFFFFFFLYWLTNRIVANYKKYGKVLSVNGAEPSR